MTKEDVEEYLLYRKTAKNISDKDIIMIRNYIHHKKGVLISTEKITQDIRNRLRIGGVRYQMSEMINNLREEFNIPTILKN